ncbi:MAG: efflux RND transporter periplasmic adaptor subunit [Saprospiraceae bacterium]|nr:efflux RND transporter periplasmic adaptor subunit [Saprospiraceae bacterium]
MCRILLFFSLISIMACQTTSSSELPSDLVSLKKLLQAKKVEAKRLNAGIEEIESAIARLDTNIREANQLVSVRQLAATDFEHYVTFQGFLASKDIVNAGSEVGGRILQVVVSEGMEIGRGQLVAKIDIESIDKQIAEVEKSLELANDIYERQSRLWDQEIGSEVQYLQAKNNKERLEKSLETLNYQRTKSNVYSPITGTVDMVMLKAGELVAPGTPIAQILDTKNLKVVADVPENLLTSVKKGDWVDIYFPSLDRQEKARINLIGRRIDPSNRTFAIEMALKDNSGILKPNLLAEIKINDFTQKDVIILPLSLVQQEVGGQDFVLVQGENDDGSFAKKAYVETGESYDGNVVIQSGLTDNDAVIDEGARGLSPNERIDVVNDTINREQ